MSEKDRHNEGSFGSRRRDVLKAVGAGTALSALAGVGAASGHGSGGKSTTSDCWCPPCIDRLSGYTALADDEDEWPARPDHVIDMYVEPRQVLFQQIPSEETDVEPGATPGGPEEEQFPDFFFDPVGLHVEPGDVVDFYNASPSLHTVTAFTERYSDPPWLEAPLRRVPEGVPPFSSPLLAAEEHWLYKFDDPGVYDLYCLPHYGLGMVVRLVVSEGDFEDPGEPSSSRPPSRRCSAPPR